jgi:RND family efflux transporter MFP subunit
MQVAVASARLAAASSFVAALSGRLALLRVRLEDTFVRAPFAGRVTVRHAEPGEWVQAGDPIVTLISIPVEAWLEVPERHLAAMRRLDGGFELELTAAGARATAARPRVVPQVHERARTFHLVGDLPNEDGALLPGMSISAWLPVSAPAEHLVVPRDSIVRRPGMISLFVVRDGEQGPFADQVPVQIRFETPDGIAVDAGPALRAGDRVIVEGNERILPRAPVAVLPAAGEPREAAGDNGERKETAGR